MRKYLIWIILLIATLLRFYNLNSVPVSLFGDELDVGYHAYSILKTGRDYSGNFMPLHFQSLAEWRTPLYLYSSVPTVALFGISPLGVRLPALIFGVLSIYVMYLLVKEITKDEKIALFSAVVLTFSPWHFQYSRAGFEVTQLLFFLILGLYLFFRSLRNPRSLNIVGSAVSLTLMPWIYSTAKFFTPFLILFLFLVWRKEILGLPKKYLSYAIIAMFIIGAPIALSTIFGGGTARFNYISVFTDPIIETEIGVARQNDARVRGEMGEGLKPTILDRLIHNKFTFWYQNISRNYFQALSADFLFNEGDPNLRHSIKGIGQFYKIEAVALLAGLVLFCSKFRDKKIKLLIGFWILAGIIPAAITRDGGNHATRLILILPPLAFLVAYGFVEIYELLGRNYKLIFALSYSTVFGLSVLMFLHNYFVHSPWDTERWWHAGFKESISAIEELEKDYKKIVISTASEPPWIFFAGWSEYDPVKWHEGYPFKKTDVRGLGEVSYIDKYYFGSYAGGLYEFGKVLDKSTLYLATAKEVNVNLIQEPQRTPQDLKLIKAIPYPSGEPAFYIFTGR